MEEYDKEFVEYIVKGIVNIPDKVEVSRKVDEMGVLLEVKVDPSDMGLLIGRSGATAKAIRVLARIVGMRNNARVNLRIIEPEGSTRGPGASAPNNSASAPVPVPAQGEKSTSIDDVVNNLGV
ncbi:MAG: KH domain-containing protein [Parcubacteria group bacterium]